jgi:hypothetical protein
MKKHSVNKVSTPSIHAIMATQKLQEPAVVKSITQHTATVPPPDEETLLLLNKLAKQSPFCHYFKGKSNDLL